MKRRSILATIFVTPIALIFGKKANAMTHSEQMNVHHGLNMCQAFLLGRETNHAITRSLWDRKLLSTLSESEIIAAANKMPFLYHGMDNVICMSNRENNSRQEYGHNYIPCAADLWANDWVLVEDVPYHGLLTMSRFDRK